VPEIGKYIYGIINSNKELAFGSLGITACETIKSVPYQDISAVVSDTEIADYTYMRRDVLARNLVRHQKAIEKIMPEYTIIPMKLGTFAKDEDEIILILSKGYQLIKDIFGKIAGKIEIDVASTWSDFPSLLKEIGEEGQIKEFKQSLLANSKGVTVDEQMKVGLMVQKAVERKNEDCAKKVLNTLKTVSQDFKAHERMDDKMIANYAFLMDKTRVGHFYKKVEELNGDFRGQINFRCVGPLPPYSFYTLEVKKMRFEEMDRARKLLNLGETATSEEIKKAHQSKAFIYHPDKNPNVPGIEKEFDEVTKAYNILQEYCQRESCSFNAEEFKKNTILVKLKK